MTTQHFVDKTLEERADERDAAARNRTMTKVAGALVNLGLAVSALLTIAYLSMLTEEATGLSDPWGYLLGILVGVVAIIPAELGLVIWRERLAGERQITGFQRVTAVVAMLLAGIFSALTTSSFFSYTLPQLFPASYLAIAPTLNVGAIVGAWIVFILAIVFYSISSRDTQQNLASAAAFQAMFDARVSVLRSSAEAVRAGAQSTVTAMEQMGVFEQDARRLIVGSLGYDENALASLPVKTTIEQRTETAVSPTTPTTNNRPATPTATAGNDRPFGLPHINLVDLGYADKGATSPGQPVNFAPTHNTVDGRFKFLSAVKGELSVAWVGSDGCVYSEPVELPSDVNEAWEEAKWLGIVNHLGFPEFEKIHNTVNFTKRGA